MLTLRKSPDSLSASELFNFAGGNGGIHIIRPRSTNETTLEDFLQLVTQIDTRKFKRLALQVFLVYRSYTNTHLCGLAKT
jgi:hypothetical protein